MKSVSGLRRTGSATIDLAWVAAGRFDGYVEHGLGPWDIAAGMLLVREAGGYVTDTEGGQPCSKPAASWPAIRPCTRHFLACWRKAEGRRQQRALALRHRSARGSLK